MTRIGINGFGRIGRSLFRLLSMETGIEVVMVNDPAPIHVLAHLLKYDSIHGVFTKNVSCDSNALYADHQEVLFSQHNLPQEVDWSSKQVDIVVESSGLFKSREQLEGHLKGEVSKVILSVPPIDDIPMVVLGVNEEILSNKPRIISNASCTTNSAAPMVQVISELAEIEKAYITTVHSYTSDQKLHDAPHKDLRRARAAAQSIVPTTTGAAKAITRIFPELDRHIGGCGIRVPVPDGSLTDITFILNKDLSETEINSAFQEASKGRLKGIVGYTEDPIVSLDVIGSSCSVLFDAQLPSSLGKMVKVVGWYDNEWGYSNRLVDLIKRLSLT